jgi:hypothetical protein
VDTWAEERSSSALRCRDRAWVCVPDTNRETLHLRMARWSTKELCWKLGGAEPPFRCNPGMQGTSLDSLQKLIDFSRRRALRGATKYQILGEPTRQVSSEQHFHHRVSRHLGKSWRNLPWAGSEFCFLQGRNQKPQRKSAGHDRTGDHSTLLVDWGQVW